MTSRRIVLFAGLVLTISGCTGQSDPTAPSSTTGANASQTVAPTGDPPICDDTMPAEFVACVLVDPHLLGPEWHDLADSQLIEQPDVIGIEELPLCDKIIVLTPREKRSIRFANIDPASLTVAPNANDPAALAAMQNALTISASVSYYADDADADRALEEARGLAELCAEWTDNDSVTHKVSIAQSTPSRLSLSVSANPLTSLLNQDSQSLCDDPDVANAIDLVIKSTEQLAMTPEQLREFICGGTLKQWLELLEPLAETSLDVRLSTVGNVFIATVAATSPTSSDTEVVGVVHAEMVSRAGG